MEVNQIVTIGVFLAVMVAIMSEKIHRTAAALAGAMALFFLHILDVKIAVSYIDFNTIGVLVGMMIFVSGVKRSGLFEYMAIKAAKLAKGDPWKIMVSFMVLTAVLSAFLDNVTTVLLVGPMTIAICKVLKLDPVPFLLSQIMSSNIGGTATLIGDPPNIMIGSAAHLSFLDFLSNTGVVSVAIMVVIVGLFRFLYGKKMTAGEAAIREVMEMDEEKAIEDLTLLRKSLIMIVMVIAGFMFHGTLGIESSIVALTAATLMMIVGRVNVEHIIVDAEWGTILFFVGLFIVVGGMVETGVIKDLAQVLIDFTHGNVVLTMMVLMWGSAILSSFLDNIPFVATLIPLILAMGNDGVDTLPLWWAVSLGACLGGNGTLVGASANVVLAGISNKQGYPITFGSFIKVGMPVMVLSMIVASAYMLIRY
ncbi:MAG: ArsB/NhaD family transporter [Clostridiales bacterium]|nr:ArsB/NhaD family transporter [Clostridiales bacterium]MDD7347029.1 ArsB/NhaD family transporter [Clostridiales bacterium]MDY4060255.1 ArsB/NhaD family transporter [Anaerovoracaceae bacterium]